MSSRGYRLYGEPEVMSRFGLKPSQLIDLAALMGDSADNIPGVRGVGIKGAVALLQRFGTMENVFAQLHEVPHMDVRGARRLWTQLSAPGTLETVLLCKLVATLREDVPLEGLATLKSSHLRYAGPSAEARKVLKILGFSTPLRMLELTYSRERHGGYRPRIRQ
ncbi:5'-3' exonuclease [Tribonema minus]|uniref:5'-3' exonuclease n=1 Tax=Tribonema minus TaxID=303371 RepID=A0A835ZAX9_9STRA|nr:5'-3' exonuclease [Tribonema minus]